MKYIRTKDGIYKIVQDLYFGRLLLNNKEIVFIGDSDIKIDDTIEELCDEYILKRSDENKPRLLNKDNLDYYKNFNKEGGPEHSYSIELFCAIWVRDMYGNIVLKPVAKLNDKGELEVLCCYEHRKRKIFKKTRKKTR